MTIRTCNRELLRHVIRISCGIVIIGMTTRTGVGCVAVVTLMTIIATDIGMCSHYRIKRVVECGWCPGCLVMAISTGCRKLLCQVIRIGCGIEIVSMAARASVGRVVVIAVVTGSTVVGNSCMRASQLIEVVVNGEGSRRPSRIGGVARLTTCGKVQRYVTRIDTLGVVVSVTTCTGVGCIVVVPLMTFVTGYACVCTREWPVVVIEVGWCPGCLPVAICTIC